MRIAAYNVTHAGRFAKINRDLMRSELFQEMFPGTDCRLPDICQADEWSTAARLALRDANPSMRAIGIRSGFVGLGADLLIVDDPYASQEEAFSEAINGGVWEWWKQDVVSRLHPDTNVVVMFHRWHDDDLAGRLHAQGGWEYLRYPSIGDGEEGDCSGVGVGEPLSPRYSVEHLREVERQQGPSAFAALFQGQPQPAGGGVFKTAWFGGRYKSLDGVKEVWTTWDTALKEKEQNDQSAFVAWALLENGQVCVLRAGRGHWETPDVQRFLIEQADWLIKVYGDRYRGDYVEDKVSGTTLIRYIRRDRPDLALIPVPAETDKVARAKGVTPICEAGRVLLPDLSIYPDAREWSEDLLHVLTRFPAGRWKDLVDAFVYGLMRVMGTIGGRKSRRGKRGGQV